MTNVTIYTTTNCPYCMAAKKLLSELNATFTEVNIENDDSLREEMIKITGKRAVPQIVIDDKPIGGFDDLSALHKNGVLQNMLEQKKEES